MLIDGAALGLGVLLERALASARFELDKAPVAAGFDFSADDREIDQWRAPAFVPRAPPTSGVCALCPMAETGLSCFFPSLSSPRLDEL
eukprot:1722972-Prymnesium_polylepis.1